ncbi:unnamed protein product [Brassica oleracea]
MHNKDASYNPLLDIDPRPCADVGFNLRSIVAEARLIFKLIQFQEAWNPAEVGMLIALELLLIDEKSSVGHTVLSITQPRPLEAVNLRKVNKV